MDRFQELVRILIFGDLRLDWFMPVALQAFLDRRITQGQFDVIKDFARLYRKIDHVKFLQRRSMLMGEATDLATDIGELEKFVMPMRQYFGEPVAQELEKLITQLKTD